MLHIMKGLRALSPLPLEVLIQILSCSVYLQPKSLFKKQVGRHRSVCCDVAVF